MQFPSLSLPNTPEAEVPLGAQRKNDGVFSTVKASPSVPGHFSAEHIDTFWFAAIFLMFAFIVCIVYILYNILTAPSEYALVSL